MADKTTFVKFDRNIKDWGWYTDVKTFKLFFHFVAYANYADGHFMGVKIQRGEMARSVDKLSLETGLTCSEVRTAIKHLEMTGEITSKAHSKFTVFSVVNYDKYQANDEHLANKSQAETPYISRGLRESNEQFDKQIASKSQTFNEHLANTSQTDSKRLANVSQQLKKNKKNKKNNKKNKNRERDTRAHGKYQNVFLSDEEFEILKKQFPDYNDKIERLSKYMADTGKTYVSHYDTIISWAREDGEGASFDEDEFFKTAIERGFNDE